MTEIARSAPGWFRSVYDWLIGLLFKMATHGASTIVRCICMDEEELDGGGHYYIDCQQQNDELHSEIRDSLRVSKSSPVGSLLWEVSEDMIKRSANMGKI